MLFQLNLSALTESARDCLTRLDASDSALRDRFRSPASRSATSMSAAMPSPLGLAHPVAGAHEVVVGPSGESTFVSSFSGGVSTLFPLFEMTLELLNTLCLGAVGNGLKFCTLGQSQCTYSTHARKVNVPTGALFISTNRNSAFTHHFLPV